MIAEFMGWTLDDRHLRSYRKRINGVFKYVHESQLKYDTDWNKLMEVVEKIERLGNCQIDISANWCRIGYKGETFNCDSRDYNYKGITKIESTYLVVVAFVKWYNEQNPKSWLKK